MVAGSSQSAVKVVFSVMGVLKSKDVPYRAHTRWGSG